MGRESTLDLVIDAINQSCIWSTSSFLIPQALSWLVIVYSGKQKSVRHSPTHRVISVVQQTAGTQNAAASSSYRLSALELANFDWPLKKLSAFKCAHPLLTKDISTIFVSFPVVFLLRTFQKRRENIITSTRVPSLRIENDEYCITFAWSLSYM